MIRDGGRPGTIFSTMQQRGQWLGRETLGWDGRYYEDDEAGCLLLT